MRNGYWMSPTNERKILLINIGHKSHISFLNKKPELFNMSPEDVKARYNYYSEPIGYEGHARNDLMIMALKNGWIRIRHHKPPYDNWMIQGSDNAACIGYIAKFLDYVLNKTKELSLYQKVTLSDLKGNVVEYTEFIDGREFFLPEERVEKIKGIQLVEKHFSDF